MTGLILKDLLNLKKQAKIYLILVIFYFVFGVTNKNPSMFSTMMTLVAVMVPITSMSYDERSKWDRYALSMPISRGTIVVSRYLIGLIFLLTAFSLTILANMVFSKMYIIEDILISSIATLSVGITIMAFIFPIMFKFGVEKGRILIMLVFIAPIALIPLLSKIGITMPNEETIKSFIYLAPIIAAVIFLASIYISSSIYKKKEF